MDYDIDYKKKGHLIITLYGELEASVLQALGYPSDYQGEIEIYGFCEVIDHNDVELYLTGDHKITGKQVDLVDVLPNIVKDLRTAALEEADYYTLEQGRLDAEADAYNDALWAGDYD